MQQHYIVCGMGHLGHHVVELLRRLGENVTVVTQGTSDDWLRAVQANGVRVLIGDARDRKVLLSAGIEHAQALIAATDQDLINIEIVLDARQLRPDLPLVVRLFDQMLTQQLQSSFNLRRVLATSRLSAPSFAAAAVGEDVMGSFSVGEHRWIIRRVKVEAGAQLENLTARQIGQTLRLGLLACDRERDGLMIPLGPEERVGASDTPILIGEHAAWEATFPSAVGARKSAGGESAEPSRLRSLLSLGWESLKRTSLRLRLVFSLLASLMLMSVLVFHWGMGLSFVDSFYFIVTTVTTVGYGDISPRTSSTWLKLYACFVMLLGSATIATLFSIITDFIVTSRFERILGRQTIPQSGHTIVVGLGNVGYRIVEELRRTSTPVVAVDRDANGQFVESVGTQVPVIIGDARLPDILRKAGVAHAHAVIATTENDAVNLSVGLGARQANPRLRAVIRLFDADFARKVQSSLNVDMALSSSLIAAPSFVASTLYPDVQAAFILREHLLTVLHRRVEGDWAGRTKGDLLREAHLLVLFRQGAAGSEYGWADEESPLREGEEVIAVAWRKLQPFQSAPY